MNGIRYSLSPHPFKWNGEKFSDRYSSTQNVLEFFFFLVRTCFTQPTDPNASGTVAEN